MGRRLFYTVAVRTALQRANAAAFALDAVLEELDSSTDERVRQAHKHAHGARAELEQAITVLHPSYRPRRQIRTGRWRDNAGDCLLRCRLCPALIWKTDRIHHLMACHALKATQADVDAHFVEPSPDQEPVPEDADAETTDTEENADE